eukprot:c56458_g1_i1.p1 GENE.c56458_g1_i1~~c56458_g1_i1.p1  ORF type:complete len:124 (+),score=4.64 c56458_g1_i1:101-472(+)
MQPTRNLCRFALQWRESIFASVARVLPLFCISTVSAENWTCRRCGADKALHLQLRQETISVRPARVMLQPSILTKLLPKLKQHSQGLCICDLLAVADVKMTKLRQRGNRPTSVISLHQQRSRY